MEKKANLVIIGAGIVGVSSAYHLAKLGWKDIVVVDKGPLFETGGSTSHAPGLIFQTNGSKMMCEFAQYTIDLLGQLHTEERSVLFPVGGIEVAYTEDRWIDLHRKLGWATSYGLEAHLITPKEVQDMIPVLDPDVIRGGYYVPSDGDTNAVHAVEAMADYTRQQGAVTYYGETTVTGFEKKNGRVKAVVTDKGAIEAELVLLCTNIWGPVLGDQLGLNLPLMSVEHQYTISEPLGELKGETREIVHPILRHQDYSMYFRQHADAYGIGSYHHEPVLVDPYDVGVNAMNPFTAHDFKNANMAAKDLIPALQGKAYPTKFNGMFAFTIDGYPIMGPAPHLSNVWAAIGVWVTHSGGVGQAIAEWMDSGYPTRDLHEADINRFYEFSTSKYYVRRTTAQQYREVYDIIHPLQQMEHTRGVRLSPYHSRLEALGGHFFQSVGWERPQWYESNGKLLADYKQEIPERAGWEALNWSAIQGAEHLTAREHAALFELSSFVKIEVSGPGAAEYLEYLTANKVAGPVGKIVYTSMLTESGGIMCDLTVTRMAEDRFWLLTGGGSGMVDLAWVRQHAPKDGSVHISDVSSNYTGIGLWGPKARLILASVAEEDVSYKAFPYFTMQSLMLETVPVLAFRLSYAGELGWEIYTPTEFGLRLWDVLWDAGQAHKLVAGGMGAFDSLRLEKGYRAVGAELHAEYNPYEAGLGWAVKLDQGEFLGRDALLKIKETGIDKKLCCLTMESGTALGKEPIFADDKCIGYVTSANYGYSVGKYIAYGYLPVEYAQKGTIVEIEYFGERFPAKVDDDPLFDPGMTRLKS